MEQPVQTETWKARSLEELVRILHRIFAEDKVSVEEVQELMESYESNPEEWLQYAKFDQYRCGDPLAGSPSLTQSRHSLHLGACAAALARYGRERGRDLGLAAERLRLARRHLGRITGHVGAEDVLDIIFRDFCVGK